MNEEYLDFMGNPLEGDKLYKIVNGDDFYITYSSASNIEPVWYATSLQGHSQAKFSVKDVEQLIPASKEAALREFERRKDFAKSNLEKISEHTNIPDLVDVMFRREGAKRN